MSNKITEIKKLKNNRYLVTIKRNDKIETKLLEEDTIIKHNLLSPRDITNKEYNTLIRENTEDFLYNKAVFFIDYQMRTIKEVKKHLKKHSQDDLVIDKIIQRLKTNQYLSDIMYTKEYIAEKIEYDLVGPKKIKDKLISKGIHFDLISEYLASYSEDIQFDKVQTLLGKELKYPIKKAYKKAYQSIKVKLVNKGFSINIIDSVMISNRELIEENCLEEDLLKTEIVKLKKQYDIKDFKQKDKVIQKLLQKGFSYNKIKQHLV